MKEDKVLIMEHKLEQKQLSEEKLPEGKGNSLLSVPSDIKSSVHILDDESNKRKEERELLEKVEKLLLGKVKEGDRTAIFQLGQFYFESVSKVSHQPQQLVCCRPL